jgi:phosphoserine aminotransferase
VPHTAARTRLTARVSDRVINFSPGPATLPLSVLEEAQATLVSLPGTGASPLEVSHRGGWFTEVIEEAEANLRLLLAIPGGHHVVFCQGGASLQFSMVAANLRRGASLPARYVLTGSWGAKAVEEARKEGETDVAWTDEAAGWVRVPANGELDDLAPSAYVHVTSNETIQGVAYPGAPPVPETHLLVADSSSEFASRPIDVARYGVVYAGAQKNIGPAGVTVVIVRDDVLRRIPDGLASMLDYRTYVKSGSLYNTPPVFAIYVLVLVTRWLRDEVGGLDEMDRRNREKAALLYAAIDESGGFYRGHADPGSRSLMNVTWRLPTEELDAAFVSSAAAEGMVELKGHRSVGGIRASIYNAMPLEGVETLAAFMREFRDRQAD